MKGIIKADARIKAKASAPIKAIILGTSGVGKTTQARTLNPKSTLFIDLEAGDLALGDWAGDTLNVRTLAHELGAHPWEMCRALAVLIGGPDPADSAGPYSQGVYDQLVSVIGDPSKDLAHIETVFIDSITVASRWAFAWAQTQPEAFSQKTGEPDTRGAYGLLGREMVRWMTHLQHAPKSVILVGILNRFEDDLKRVTWEPQIEGSKAGRELAGIFDQVLALDYLYDERGKAVVGPDGEKVRAFYTKTNNAFGFPAKDRSGVLDPIEEPNLARLLAKARGGKRKDTVIKTDLPPSPAKEGNPPAPADSPA